MGSSLGFIRILFLGLLVSTAVANNNSTCHKPKVRREWRTLSDSERTDWLKAVNCLTTIPHDPNVKATVPVNISEIQPVDPNSSYYDDFVYLHMDLNHRIHFTGMFLPWHRYYVQFFEDALTKKCGYKGVQPYWDWTLDAPDFYNSKFFDNSSSGVGGWGDPENDFQITTGGLKDMVLTYPNRHHIRRNFTLYPLANPNFPPPWGNDPSAPPPPGDLMINTTFSRENVDYLISNFEGDFLGFSAYYEAVAGPHGGVHQIHGGDMAGTCSGGAVPPECIPGAKWPPNDPLFFLHHAMIDKIWYDWQKKSPKNVYAFGGGSVQASTSYAIFEEFPTGLPPDLNYSSEMPGDGLWGKIEVWDVIDTTGDTLCYVYA